MTFQTHLRKEGIRKGRSGTQTWDPPWVGWRHNRWTEKSQVWELRKHNEGMKWKAGEVR